MQPYFRLLILLLPLRLFSQSADYIEVREVPGSQKVIVKASHQPFTEFAYSDTLEKPVLYPIYAPDGALVTRGYPLSPRPGEPIDHPHHVGLWMNYENVNGLDFWNNSFAIPADRKHLYGWIRTIRILEVSSGLQGRLTYMAAWVDSHNDTLLRETTTFFFRSRGGIRTIDRVCFLTAAQDILFQDAKDGLLGLRVAHELELPSREKRQYIDGNGNITDVQASQDNRASGNYLTSEGRQGDSAWGTRAAWCMLYGKINRDSVSIVLMDHPSNPGYPTYWHARGYGLFAANPLGVKIFSGGKQELNFRLKKNERACFRYRIAVASGKRPLDRSSIGNMAAEFAKTK